MNGHNTKTLILAPDGWKSFKELSENSGIKLHTIYYRWRKSGFKADYAELTKPTVWGKGGRRKKYSEAKPLQLWSVPR